MDRRHDDEPPANAFAISTADSALERRPAEVDFRSKSRRRADPAADSSSTRRRPPGLDGRSAGVRPGAKRRSRTPVLGASRVLVDGADARHAASRWRRGLALFWHDHFAVAGRQGGERPDDAGLPSHAATIRGRDASWICSRQSQKEPAMMKYLDMNRQVRGVPNENFAREVMELFTLGIGNYSEDDVPGGRARPHRVGNTTTSGNDLPGDAEQRFRDSIRFERPFVAFYTSPRDARPCPEGRSLDGPRRSDGDGPAGDVGRTSPDGALRLRQALGTLRLRRSRTGGARRADRSLEADARRRHRHRGTRSRAAPEFFRRARLPQSGEESHRGHRRASGAPAGWERRFSRTARRMRTCGRASLSGAWTSRAMPPTTRERMGMTLLQPSGTCPVGSGERPWTSAALMAERMKFRGLRPLARRGPSGRERRERFDALSPARPKDELELAASFAELFDVPLPAARLQILAGGVAPGRRPEGLGTARRHGEPSLPWSTDPHGLARDEPLLNGLPTTRSPIPIRRPLVLDPKLQLALREQPTGPVVMRQKVARSAFPALSVRSGGDPETSAGGIVGRTPTPTRTASKRLGSDSSPS